MLKLNKLKNLFKKQPKKQTVTFKTSKLDFIGKTKTLDILSEQEVDKKIEQAIAQIPPGGGGPIQPPFDPTDLQQEDLRLQGEIDKTNVNVGNLQIKVDTNEVNIDNLGSQTQQLGDMVLDNQQEIIVIKQKDTQQDSILRNVPRLNGINQFTDTNTFQRLRCKSPATGDEEVVRQREFTAEVRRLEGLIPPGGGGPTQPPYNDQPIKQEIANLKQKVTQVEQTHNVDKQNLESRIDNVSKNDNNFQVPQSGQTPTQNNHLATKQYVDNKVAQGGGQPPFDPTDLQQEDLRLQGEIDKTNAKVTTVEQTANNANQKANDNEQAITDLEQEDTDIKRRLTALENAPPGGGGLTTNIDNCVVLKFTKNENRTLVLTTNAGAGGFYFARTSRYTFSIPKPDLIRVYERIATPQEKAQGQEVQVNVGPVVATFQTGAGTPDYISGVGVTTATSNPFVNPTGGVVNIAIDRITGLVNNNLSQVNKWVVHLTVVLSRKN